MDWSDIPSLMALRAFEAAARHGSLSAAARDLNVTHAAIGQHLRTLETHFGVSLLERDGRGMTPTAEGQKLASALSDAFGTIASASRDLLDQSKTRAVRVATTPSLAANWLMPRLGRFWEAYPDVEIEIVPSTQLIDLRRDGIDVAIRYGKGGWPGVANKRLMFAGHVAVASPSYIGERKITCLADLKGARWLMDGMRSEERLWIAENGIDLSEEMVTQFPTSQLSREAALSGLGVTVLPAPIADQLAADGKVVILCREENSDIAYHILTRPDVISPARDTFVKWLRSSTD